MKSFYISEDGEIISSDAFIACGNERRKELGEKYSPIELEDMVRLTGESDSWDDFDEDWYIGMADAAGLNYEDYSDMFDLMDDIDEFLKNQKENK